ncbi:fungal-specific transcription factor domain-domain-containing protein [Naematelia encephala]|uniref:Fungal-specific transcription factor domain-domain-containing protein n=1 Tax=Naematelia encephala TaxID=71784 RepID=A0A1Y2ATF5_9TREE|nr:fungal-specific transcription factor domain-domain-containing protein [Naematelia encephala]
MSASTSKSRGIRSRVWRACEICRKRKIRCDGQDPCGFCSTNNKHCSFSLAQDHASLSRQRENDTLSRLEKLEDRLDKLIPLIETTHSFISQSVRAPVDNLGSLGSSSTQTAAQDVATTPPVNNHLPSIDQEWYMNAFTRQSSDVPTTGVDSMENGEGAARTGAVDGLGEAEEASLSNEEDVEEGVQEEAQKETQEEEVDENVEEGEPHKSWADRLAGQFARDSTGNMRYLGGTPTFVLREAVDSVRQGQLPPAPDQSPSSSTDRPTVDQLYFRPNVFYRPLDGLPAPELVQYPPMVLSNALVQMYFSKIHHTFPIVDKSYFMKKYLETMEALRRGQPSRDAQFLCLLFAVYASAASLTKKVFRDRTEFEFSSPTEYIGLEFYEKALYMYWIGYRAMKIEHVACMGLLSACLAGWNTLAHSWFLAGQAVRGAQDLGLHRSPNKAATTAAEKEYRRRVWWCVYGLDKILSVSLGRPSGIDDDDCDVELPSDQTCCEGNALSEPPGDNPMTGFNSLVKIYTIAGRIERTAHSISFLNKYDNSADHPKVRETIRKLDDMLSEWSESLPSSVRYAANNPNRPDMFALCLLGHFALYACILNLHRPFMPDLNTSSPLYTFKSLQKCVDAARGCIRVGEEVKKLLPTTHHCQFCVQYLTISGITLLRCLPYVSNSHELIKDAMHCRYLLGQLEDTWPGSKTCGSLLQELLDICQKNKRTASVVRRMGATRTPVEPGSLATHHGLNGSKKRRINEASPVPQRALPREAPDSRTAPDLERQVHGDATSTPSMGSDHNAFGPTQTLTPTTPSVTQPITSTGDQSMDWDLPADLFDYSYLTNGAPFDLADQIGALLETIQNPASVEPEW